MSTSFILIADAWGFLVGMSATALFLALAVFLFWVWAMIHCASNARISMNEKVIWLLVIFFLPFVGAILYFAARPGRTPQLHA
jgi:hypothetical protein